MSVKTVAPRTKICSKDLALERTTQRQSDRKGVTMQFASSLRQRAYFALRVVLVRRFAHNSYCVANVEDKAP